MLTRSGLMFLVVLALLLWTVSAPSTQVLAQQFDGPEIQAPDLSGDSDAPEPVALPKSGYLSPSLYFRPSVSPGLCFTRTPVRLLSYPGLSQGPPALI